jgi:hypothetical protein
MILFPYVSFPDRIAKTGTSTISTPGLKRSLSRLDKRHVWRVEILWSDRFFRNGGWIKFPTCSYMFLPFRNTQECLIQVFFGGSLCGHSTQNRWGRLLGQYLPVLSRTWTKAGLQEFPFSCSIYITGWWFGTFFPYAVLGIFGSHTPVWQIYFRGIGIPPTG